MENLKEIILEIIKNKDFTSYSVVLDSENHMERLDNFDRFNRKEAEEEFECNSNKNDDYDQVILFEETNEIDTDLDEIAIEILEKFGWEEIDEIDQDDIYETVKHDYLEVSSSEPLNSLDLPNTNDSSDQLLNNVIDELNNQFKNIEFSKYTSIYIDEDGNMNSKEGMPVNIRIADHTHNPSNGKNDLNVLITNNDVTESRFRFANTHLCFNENNNLQEIIEEIVNYWK